MLTQFSSDKAQSWTYKISCIKQYSNQIPPPKMLYNHCKEMVLNIYISFFVSTYTRFYCHYNAVILFLQFYGNLVCPYISAFDGTSLCVNEISAILKGWENVSPLERTRRLRQISTYQRISSLDLVRAKPHKNTKLIFTVIIRCLVLLCWTLSHFSNTFPTKGTQLDTTTLIIWKNIDTRERDREIKGRFFFCSLLLHCEIKSAILLSSCHQFYEIDFYPKKSHRFDEN